MQIYPFYIWNKVTELESSVSSSHASSLHCFIFMLVLTTVISTSTSTVVFLKPSYPLTFRMGADWIRTIGWVLKISSFIEIFISVLIPYWICKSTLLVMHLSLSTELGKIILIRIFGKETKGWSVDGVLVIHKMLGIQKEKQLYFSKIFDGRGDPFFE